jgi:alkaline phosphatase
MRRFSAALGVAVFLAAPAVRSQTVYPIDRADILAGARFDLKVEFPALADPAKVAVTVNGEDHAKVFGKAAAFIEREDGKDQSALILRDVSLARPGDYTLRATDGTNSRDVTWSVYGTGPRKPKNAILFIGDGMSLAHRVAARMLSKGIVQGKAKGKLAMDDMPHMALVSTSGTDSIVTDSANSATAYTTGHKSANNALGVYADRTESPFDDPRVELITTLAKRRHGMAIGVVTNTEIEDATPASMVAHTRRRAEYDRIVEQFLELKPDVIMGGGAANFLPASAPGGKRKDRLDFIQRFRDAGYPFAATAGEMTALGNEPSTTRLLGLFHPGNMDGVLDRKFLKGGTVKDYPQQPDLSEQVKTALQILSRNDAGFVLMVESGLIDKYTHVLDMERAVYDTIMLDNAVRLASDWSRGRGDDTLIMVIADHTHPVSLVGTMDDDMSTTPNVGLRERVRVMDRAGYPNYPAPDAEGYPPRVDVSRRLSMFVAAMPDHFETFRPKLDNPNAPTIPGKQPGTFEANERYKDAPGAMLRPGNMPATVQYGVHAADDVILTASGPGSDRVHGHMENTEVFRVIADALGLGEGAAPSRAALP